MAMVHSTSNVNSLHQSCSDWVVDILLDACLILYFADE